MFLKTFVEIAHALTIGIKLVTCVKRNICSNILAADVTAWTVVYTARPANMFLQVITSKQLCK